VTDISCLFQWCSTGNIISPTDHRKQQTNLQRAYHYIKRWIAATRSIVIYLGITHIQSMLLIIYCTLFLLSIVKSYNAW